MAAAKPDAPGLVDQALALGRELADARRPERSRLSREAMLREAVALAGVADVAALEEQAARVRALPFLADRAGREAAGLAAGPARAPAALPDEPNRGQPGLAAYLERLTTDIDTRARALPRGGGEAPDFLRGEVLAGSALGVG